MEAPECPPVTVEGDWSPDHTKTIKNKLHIYFQSKKKSSGGDCRVEAEDGAPRAAVYFRSEEGESAKTHRVSLSGNRDFNRLKSQMVPQTK